VTILALKSALFNEMGLRLWPAAYQDLPRQVSMLLEDQVRAVALSLHLQDGTYAEITFDPTADIAAKALGDAAHRKLGWAREDLASHVARLSGDPYWDELRKRIDRMLADVFRNLRIGVEFDQVHVNLWLPEMAAHNLAAAAELTMVSSANVGQRPGPAEPPTAIPGNLAELLAAKRTLRSDNPPDLNILIDNLQRDLLDDFPGLPFKFELRLSSADLSEAGITRNQRVAKLDFVDLPLSMVLTQICFMANPDKNATDPRDTRCRLVWVVTRDEGKDCDVILLTTRDAASKNGWKLPSEFAGGS
jgi:hypothetical protein